MSLGIQGKMLPLAIPCYHRLEIASQSGGLGVVGSNPAAPTNEIN